MMGCLTEKCNWFCLISLCLGSTGFLARTTENYSHYGQTVFHEFEVPVVPTHLYQLCGGYLFKPLSQALCSALYVKRNGYNYHCCLSVIVCGHFSYSGHGEASCLKPPHCVNCGGTHS
ncbi:hypothetical protein L798_00429 [Zootermopsis nevadensis]|uniref:Secreted protein n=1 Tax=Zootermopsis nevadensis TaxID=136037 RepID=A0A067QVK5_ZOONE|nr:hypothetical protein L798_00429 [Zootermopsis nevadensis]